MVEVRLYRKGELTELVATIDDADAERVAAYRWHVFVPTGSKTRYARCNIGGKTIYLHRFVMNAEDRDEIDHIDGDGLLNTRGNLRFVTRRENLRSARRLPGRYGNPSIAELDRELEEFEARLNNLATEATKTAVKTRSETGT